VASQRVVKARKPARPKIQALESGAAVKLFAVEVPLDLRSTLSTLGGRFMADGWWWATRTPEGPGTLHLRRPPAGVEARAFGPGASFVLGLVPDLVGFHDHPEHLVTDHPVIRALQQKHRGMRIGRTKRVFDVLVTAIVAQKVTGIEAGIGARNLRRLYSDPAPGPMEGLRLPPDPERLAQAPYYDLHPLGIEKRRADIIRRVAAMADRIDRLAELPSADARRQLESIPGVGQWTSAEVVAVSHGDPDVVSVGDYHIKHQVAWHLTGEPRATDQRMLELLEPFRPQRGRVVRLLGRLGNEPRFGPRMPLRAIKAM
jgi:3-methyladenine DNA glycosylase/8-oxoguanine DNA glycosylase